MKHLIDIMQLTPQEIMELIDTACAVSYTHLTLPTT